MKTKKHKKANMPKRPEWRPTEELRPYPLEASEQLVKQCRELGDVEAAELYELAEKHGMTPSGVIKHEHLLAEIGLGVEDIDLGAVVRANQLQVDASREMQEFVKRWNAKYAPPPPPDPAWAAKEDDSGGKRPKLFGFPVTAVLRWMGVDGWKQADAKKALRALGYNVADATISAQLRAGRDGTRGDPATLTLAQEDALYNAGM